jgi:Tfp pilus assembly protein PilN
MSQNSFLPEDYLQRRVAQRTNLLCISLFAVVLVGVVGAFYVTDRQRSEVRAELQQVNNEFQSRAQQLAQIERLQEQKQHMLDKARITAMLVERVPRSNLLAELVNAMPASLTLTELSLETSLVQPTQRPRTALERERQNQQASDSPQIAPREINLQIAGVAPDDREVSTFMGRLSNHPMFDEAELLLIDEVQIEQVSMRQFRLSTRVRQDVELDQLDELRVADAPQDPMADQVHLSPDGQTAPPPEQLGAVPTE